jgi:anti-sigma regulatory factor (Ser/Thr protein kinase)
MEILAGSCARWAVKEIQGRSRMRPHKSAQPPATQHTLPHGSAPTDLAAPFDVTLVAGPGAASAARAALTSWMGARVGAPTLIDARLVVSELVSNSLRHADAPADALIRLSGHVRGDVLWLEVGDRGSAGSIVRRAPDPHHGGFGLNIVEALSQRWGVNRDAGTRVWAELALTPAG